MTAIIPDKNDKYIIALMEMIGVRNAPVLIDVVPEKDSKASNCFLNVQKKVLESGGKMVLGWQLWKSQNLMEAEFHAVWESPEKQLTDLTPKVIICKNKTLFLFDDKLTYEDKQKDNYRINITTNPLVDDFIKICEAIFIFENKGDRAKLYQDEFKLSELENKNRNILIFLQNFYGLLINSEEYTIAKCFCGSGIRLNSCHGKHLQKILSKLV